LVLQLSQCENWLYDGPEHLGGPTLEQTEQDPDKSRRIGKMLATRVVRQAVIPDSANRESEFQLVVRPSLLTARPSHLAYARIRVSQQHPVRFLSIASLEFRFPGL
jgi:hypothetical protein